LTPSHKMAIEDEIKNAFTQARKQIKLDNPNLKKAQLQELQKNATIDIEKVLDNLRNTKALEGVKLTEGLIEDIIKGIKEVEKFEKVIKESCQNMLNSKAIAKKLAETDLKNAQDAIDALVGSYGKILSKFKSMTIFTLVVRFLVPIAMVKPGAKIKKKIMHWQQQRQAQKTQKA